jgi:hypothetical protein
VQFVVLDPATWRARKAAHEARVDGWVAPHRARQQHAIKHPVEDFLFTYYSFRPSRLRRWHPGAGIVLEGARDFGSGYLDTAEGSTVDVAAVLCRRGAAIGWTRDLLAATATRQPQFGCFGMHEWAMVYEQSQAEVRHNAWPLRLSTQDAAEVLRERGVRCTHFDAFRFFTPPARPLNTVTLSRATQVEHEQPGCLHANMDLYKWAYKLLPIVASELVADCLALTREVRALDMRASPYDLVELGFEPVRVETPEGRAEYVAAQRSFAERAAPLRDALIRAIDNLAT